MELVKIDTTFLEGIAAYNLSSPESLQPFLPDYKKETIQAESMQVVQRVKDGEISALNAHLMAKALVKMADVIVDQTKAETIKEAATYGKDQSTLFGASFQVANSPNTYDFESDTVYAELNEQLKKRRELLSQSLKTTADMVDINGEVIPKVPVKSHGGETLKVTFK
jgi:hypothetical protein